MKEVQLIRKIDQGRPRSTLRAKEGRTPRRSALARDHGSSTDSLRRNGRDRPASHGAPHYRGLRPGSAVPRESSCHDEVRERDVQLCVAPAKPDRSRTPHPAAGFRLALCASASWGYLVPTSRRRESGSCALPRTARQSSLGFSRHFRAISGPESEPSSAPDARKPLLNRGFSEWAMRDSNPRPLPCEGSALAS